MRRSAKRRSFAIPSAAAFISGSTLSGCEASLLTPDVGSSAGVGFWGSYGGGAGLNNVRLPVSAGSTVVSHNQPRGTRAIPAAPYRPFARLIQITRRLLPRPQRGILRRPYARQRPGPNTATSLRRRSTVRSRASPRWDLGWHPEYGAPRPSNNWR